MASHQHCAVRQRVRASQWAGGDLQLVMRGDLREAKVVAATRCHFHMEGWRTYLGYRLACASYSCYLARRRTLDVLKGASRALAARLLLLLVVECSGAAVCGRAAAHRTEGTLAADVAVLLTSHRHTEPLGSAAGAGQGGGGALSTIVAVGAVLDG